MDVGDTVEAGDVLAHLDTDRLAREVQQAQAALASAKAQLAQLQDGPRPEEVAAAEANLRAAQAQVSAAAANRDQLEGGVGDSEIAAAEATVNQAFIKAPFDGVITMVDVKPGDQTNPGTIAFRVDDLSRLLVDLEVSEVDINQIKEGQEVTMSFDAILAKEYHGEVVDVALVGNNIAGVVNFTVTIELLDADEEVRPGMTSDEVQKILGPADQKLAETWGYNCGRAIETGRTPVALIITFIEDEVSMIGLDRLYE